MVENPPAFPLGVPHMTEYQPEWGMSLRDHFAGQALVGLLASGKWDNSGVGFEDFISTHAGNIADAMLAQRAAARGEQS